MAEAGRLQRLIENLLDLGKIERGARTYALAAHDLAALVEEAIAQATSAPPGPYELTRELTPGISIEADADAARQAIANLVHNALKYGGGQLTVSTRRDGDWGVVDVADRGPGIPEGRRKAIFEPYVRLEDEARRESQGTGLGLALVKGYMDGQGGSVKVEPRPGGGSVFSLRFRAC
jgi:two-component system sensor histidine kinase KdpD